MRRRLFLARGVLGGLGTALGPKISQPRRQKALRVLEQHHQSPTFALLDICFDSIHGSSFSSNHVDLSLDLPLHRTPLYRKHVWQVYWRMRQPHEASANLCRFVQEAPASTDTLQSSRTKDVSTKSVRLRLLSRCRRFVFTQHEQALI